MHSLGFRYVDANRLAAVGTITDLKSEINSSNIRSQFKKGSNQGDPDDKFYIKQALYMIR